MDDKFCEIYPCDEIGSGWEPEIDKRSGSTGWLHNEFPIASDLPFSLTFSIHDEGDDVSDSIVFIDNFT